MFNTTFAFKAEKKQTSCAYCGVGCGLDIELHNNKPIKLTGANTHPANKGRVCVKGTNLLDTIDQQGRLLKPQIDNQEVSWQCAIEHVADSFTSIIKQYGKEAIALYVSGQLLTEDYYVANKFLKGYIGSANIDTNSRLCMSSAVAAYKRAFGEDVVPCNYEDLEHANVVFFVGSNAAWTHPVLFQRMLGAKQADPNMMFVALDPRATATTKMADIHLPLLPGTDAGFYNGLLHYLDKYQHIDQDYIAQATSGFNEALEQAQSWTLARVSQFCGLAPSLLVKAYQLFAKMPNVVSFYSMGINQSNSGVDKCNAIINCHLATGKIAKLGNGPFSITGQPNAMGGREVGGLSNQLTAHLDINNSSHQQLVKSFWQSPTIATKAGASATEIIEQIEQGKIKAIWIMATNPLVSLPDRNRVIAALKKCPLVIVSDCVEHNDTLAFADVKLPATTWLEKDGTVTNSERMVSRQRGMIAGPGKVKHDWKIICEVAQKMGFSGFDYQESWQIFKEFCQLTGQKHTLDGEPIKRLFDLSSLQPSNKDEYDALKPSQWPLPDHQGLGQRPFSDQAFSTHDGKARFIAITPVLPNLINTSEFPFILNSGRIRDQWHTMTRTAKAIPLNQHVSRPLLAINPTDAKQKNLVNGDWVTVKSAVGKVVVEVELTDDIELGQCFMPIHWNQQFASHANIANIFPTVIDPISQQPQVKQVAVSYQKLNFEFATHIHLAHDIASQLIPASLGVFSKTIQQGYHSYFMVTDKQTMAKLSTIEAMSESDNIYTLCAAIKVMLSNNVKWFNLFLSYEGIGRLLGTIEGRVVAIIECVDLTLKATLQSNPNQWLDYIFSQSTLLPQDKNNILTANVAEKYLLGRQVCSCFNVHKKTIECAILDGNDTLEKLAIAHKCGSGCGSCKPDLTIMIDTFIKKTVKNKTMFSNRAHNDVIAIARC